MSNQTSAPARHISGSGLEGLQERRLLQAELVGHDAQLQNFTPLRDRLVASGQDANAKYRQIAARRDEVIAELEATTSRPAGARGPVLYPRSSPFQQPGLGGYSGFLPLPPAHEGTNTNAQGQYQATGSITTDALEDDGNIVFHAGLQVASGDVVDPTLQYFWQHNWYHLINFPSPVVNSNLTYSFEFLFYASVQRIKGYATLMSFISVGEAPDYDGYGQPLLPTTDVAWPLIADLTQPQMLNGGNYNGNDGELVCPAPYTLRRTFAVRAGHFPAVMLVFGLISLQSTGSAVSISEGLSNSIFIKSPGGLGLVAYRYDPSALGVSPH